MSNNGTNSKVVLSPEEQLKAVKKNPLCIKNIENPTEEAQLAAVSIWPMAIKEIANPSDDVQFAAVNRYSGVEHLASKITSKSPRIQNLLALRLWHELNGNVPENLLSMFSGDALHLAKYGLLEKEVNVIKRGVSLGKTQLFSLVKDIGRFFPNPNKVKFFKTEPNIHWPVWVLSSTSSGLQFLVRALVWENQKLVPHDVPAKVISEDEVVKITDSCTVYDYATGTDMYKNVCSALSKYISIPVHSVSVFVSDNPTSIRVGRSFKEKGAYEVNVYISSDEVSKIN